MIHRRKLLKLIAATGIGNEVFHRAIAVTANDRNLTRESLQQAAWVSDLELSDQQYDQILTAVNNHCTQLESLRNSDLDYETEPAFQFQTRAARQANPAINRQVHPRQQEDIGLPADDESIALLPVSRLSRLLQTRQLSSQRLTAIYLNRLRKYGPMLRCVVNLTEPLAIKQAARADQEIAAGNYRGPLHGIPWGAKDLISVPGYPTTWGMPQYQDRVIDEQATVYRRLEDAGAVLVAKLSLGAIAMGDRWYEGRTRNPWNPARGSSGSSAGSAAATVAGLVGFSLGTETLGSITSPSRVCGSCGFRPTFGRVSRFGCMPLSWTMDKVGPICRSAEDCALVFAAIHGADALDSTAEDAAFDWPMEFEPGGLKIGYSAARAERQKKYLECLQALGFELVEVELPSTIPVRTLANIIDIEAACGFDKLLREGKTEGWNDWPQIFRAAQYIPAIEYVRMMRLRTKLMIEFEQFMSRVDLLFNVFDVFHTNLTGHPSIVVPAGFRESRSGGQQPVTVSFTGHLNDDARLLAVADRFSQSLEAEQVKPDLDSWLDKYNSGELDSHSNPGEKSG